MGVVHPHHDAVRAHKVVNRRAFFEKLRVGHHAEGDVGAAFGQGGGHGVAHAVGGAHRHGGFVHHHGGALDMAGNAARGGQHILQISRAVFVGRGAHGDKLNLAKAGGGGHVSGEAQPAGGGVAADHVFQAGLVNRHAAALQQGDFGWIDIQAQHLIADFGQTRAGDQAHIAAANHRDFHCAPLACATSALMRCSTANGSSARVIGRPITR